MEIQNYKVGDIVTIRGDHRSPKAIVIEEPQVMAWTSFDYRNTRPQNVTAVRVRYIEGLEKGDARHVLHHEGVAECGSLDLSLSHHLGVDKDVPLGVLRGEVALVHDELECCLVAVTPRINRLFPLPRHFGSPLINIVTPKIIFDVFKVSRT